MSLDIFASSTGPVLVIAPHPDDEILGAGGTIAKLCKAGREVHVCVVTSGRPPLFSPEQTQRVREETTAAHKGLGVKQTHWLGLPAAELTEVPTRELNGTLGKLVAELAPSALLIPHVGDIHIDHQLVHLAAMVSARPHQEAFPPMILAYETLSETNWNTPGATAPFIPNVFVDITDTLEDKLTAFAMFGSQDRGAPHERSVPSLRALATLRGATVHRHAAEAFILIRHVGG
ncbi:PIG-L family deacetylase [Halocynthiibacter sp. C4]|uniref:PIG-L deacetylase family protein n=1 Tax=Halocynthiibacter sp. C4 TaxID=2992758 RepID=UPI00237B111E|nr:PIG-L deacetylase family protein [Halocynthiibacter sp. C4]MDE0589462.1 PIG-L family deacetylase [Halocynthiibacter sp. C4]